MERRYLVLMLFAFKLILFESCVDNLPTFNIEKEKSIDAISDSILFSAVKCLTIHDDHLFFTDTRNDLIICLDKDLSLHKIIGKRGQGPEELLGITQFSIKDSLIAVLNGGNNRINVFKTDGLLLKEYSLANVDIRFHTAYRFCFDGTEFVGCSSVAETPLTAYNIDTQKQSFFGEEYKFSSNSQASIRNDRLTAHYNGNYITVSDNLPIIEVYDEKTKQLVAKYDYAAISIVKSTLESIQRKPLQDSNSYYTLCEDIYIANNRLYLLIANYQNDYSVNEIIEFELEPQIMPRSVIKLTGEVYTSFCLSNKFLYGYDSHYNTIDKFSLSTLSKR